MVDESIAFWLLKRATHDFVIVIASFLDGITHLFLSNGIGLFLPHGRPWHREVAKVDVQGREAIGSRDGPGGGGAGGEDSGVLIAGVAVHVGRRGLWG